MTQDGPREQPVTPGLVDPTVPSPARVWNFWVGGSDHFAADRALAEQFGQVVRDMPLIARLARQFTADIVSKLAGAGIRQFLDIGTGLPAADSTHEDAQRLAPDSRVVYVDADLRDPATILTQAARTLDFSQPVAVLLVAVLHFIPDSDDPHRIVTTLKDAVPPAATWRSCTAPATPGTRTCRRPSDATMPKPRPGSTPATTSTSASSSTAWNWPARAWSTSAAGRPLRQATAATPLNLPPTAASPASRRCCDPGDMPSVASLRAFRQAIAEFPVTDLPLVTEPAALAAARRSLDCAGLLLPGERHGVRENPLIIRALMRHLGLTNLVLEWPDDLTPVIRDFLAEGTLADHPGLWSGDGRLTAGHLTVLAERRPPGRST